jgi:ankyrin repeat protein
MDRESTRRQLLGGPLAWAVVATLTPAARWAEAEPRSSPASRLLAAVRGGDLDAVRFLLDADPDLLAVRDAEGRSAFAVALLHGHRRIAELLRSRGWEPDLHESALALDWERLDSLAAASPHQVDADHPVGGSAMVAAALGGAGRAIWHVYAVGGHPDLPEQASRRRTALIAALEAPDLPTAELTAASLLGNGADPNARQPGPLSPLHVAASRGSLAIVEMLIRKGAEIGALDAEGRSARELALERGHREVAALLAAHAEIPRDHSTSRRAWDVDGRPYVAADLSHLPPALVTRTVGSAHFDLEATRSALESHPELAHATATTTEGAVEGGAHTGRQAIVELLLERGAPYSLPSAVMRGDLARVRALLDEDPLRIHERGPHDFALLWYPVIGGGRRDLAELLLARGAEVERQHWLGTTALHWAARWGQLEMAALLLERGADPDRVGRQFDDAGQTPHQVALDRGHDAVAQLLRDRGARS